MRANSSPRLLKARLDRGDPLERFLDARRDDLDALIHLDDAPLRLAIDDADGVLDALVIAPRLRRLDAHLLDALAQPLHHLDEPILLGEGARDLRLQFVEAAVRHIGRVAPRAGLLDQFGRLRLQGADRAVRLADAAVHIGERGADAVLIELPRLRVLHLAAPVVVEIGAHIGGHHLDVLDDLIAPPDPRHLIAHEGPQFVDLLLEVVDRHRVAPPPLFVAGAGVHRLPRVHRAGVPCRGSGCRISTGMPSPSRRPRRGSRIPRASMWFVARCIVPDVAITSRYLAITVLLRQDCSSVR